MGFILYLVKLITISLSDVESPAENIADYIKNHLIEKKAVLWLLPGGSATKVAVRARQLIGPLNKNEVLHVALTDERYGEKDHLDSNALQLIDAGFDIKGLKLHTPLKGYDIKVTSLRYDDTIEKIHKEVDATIGLFGMGSDGHTAGLLPGNPLMNSSASVGYFEGFDFQRITITPNFLRKIDKIVLYAVGEPKWSIIKKIKTTQKPVSCLLQAKSLTVYSDYKEGEL